MKCMGLGKFLTRLFYKLTLIFYILRFSYYKVIPYIYTYTVKDSKKKKNIKVFINKLQRTNMF